MGTPATDELTSRLLVTLTVDELRAVVRAEIAAELARLARLDSREKKPALLTVPEAATELRRSVPTIRRLISRGLLQTVRLGHGGSARVLIPRESLEALIAGAAA
jgi:excisionase family DNA binding protein